VSEPRSLFDPPDPHTLARTTDPGTSHEAAGSLVAVRITRTRQAILECLRRHPDGLSDEQIAQHYRGPAASPSGLRTRRSELTEAGLIRDSGRKTRTRSGRRTIIWTAAVRINDA
jgi:hypothetical protein